MASLRQRGAHRPALVVGDRVCAVHDIAAAAGMHLDIPDDGGAAVMLTPLRNRDPGLLRVLDAAATVEVASTGFEALGAPVPHPGKIICIGRNYAEHARESGSDVPSQPLLFAKFANAITGPGDDIVRPREVDDLDYEGELCVVIGAPGRRVPRERALDLVGGYCCANDVSARTAQFHSGGQWLRGKSYDTFCPIGPVLVSPGELGDVQQLRIRTRVDGEVRQDDTTASMVFDVAALIAYASDIFTLEPGDLILTGTPPGVAMGRTPPPWLQPGQLCEVEIHGIGTLANRVVQETDPAVR